VEGAMDGKNIFELSMEDKWREDTKRAYNTILSMGDKVKRIAEEDAIELLQGAVDMHVHAFPDPEIDVGWDQIEITKKATDLGIAAVVFKAHTIPTAATVYYAQKTVDEYAQRIEKSPRKHLVALHLIIIRGG
jgi:hypothetical protein